nr:T9SS type A sorting domain-containing protein [Segetibacter sp.]
DGNAFIRQANYAKYSYKQILIPMSKFVEGKNTITLVMPSNSGWVSHLMYDYISLEASVVTSLPIQLLSFSAVPAPNDEVLLNWSTSSEQNNDRFEVSHSLDGINFKVIATIKGKGTTLQQQQYSIYDKHPENGINYYRLMQYNLDGKPTNYGTKTVTISTTEQVNLQVYPNPSNGKVSLQLTAYRGTRINVTMLTADGKIIHQEAIKTTANSTLYPLHLNFKPNAGLYILQVTGTDINRNLKVQFR